MIHIYNRKTKTYEIEKIAGENYIKWSYDSPVGKSLTELLVKKKLFSKLYGTYCDTPLSKKKISKFIKDFDIDMEISSNNLDDFKNFNDFFVRNLKKESRPITNDKNILISPGDGRLFAYENISVDNLIQVKGIHYSLSELLNDNEISKEYDGGTCLVLRLSPTDYHRFHFVDSGLPLKSNFINGNYYSVNPIALERIPKLYCQNKREWSLFKSDNFNDIIHIEVGATCVGTIIQTYTPNKRVQKSDEKGYFKFGGSTTILLFKKGIIKIDKDILTQTELGFECKVLMGENIGRRGL